MTRIDVLEPCVGSKRTRKGEAGHEKQAMMMVSLTQATSLTLLSVFFDLDLDLDLDLSTLFSFLLQPRSRAAPRSSRPTPTTPSTSSTSSRSLRSVSLHLCFRLVRGGRSEEGERKTLPRSFSVPSRSMLASSYLSVTRPLLCHHPNTQPSSSSASARRSPRLTSRKACASASTAPSTRSRSLCLPASTPR